MRSGGVRQQELNVLGIVLHIDVGADTLLEVALQGVGQHGVGQIGGGSDDETLVAYAEAVGHGCAVCGIFGAHQGQLQLAGFCGANALGEEVLRCLHGIAHGNHVDRVGHENEHQ